MDTMGGGWVGQFVLSLPWFWRIACGDAVEQCSNACGGGDEARQGAKGTIGDQGEVDQDRLSDEDNQVDGQEEQVPADDLAERTPHDGFVSLIE